MLEGQRDLAIPLATRILVTLEIEHCALPIESVVVMFVPSTVPVGAGAQFLLGRALSSPGTGLRTMAGPADRFACSRLCYPDARAFRGAYGAKWKDWNGPNPCAWSFTQS